MQSTATSLETLFESFRRDGDATALGTVFDRTAVDLFRLALFLAPDASEAEDLLQSTFLTAIESATEWDAARPVLPWLTGILGNHARHARRRSNRRPIPDKLPASSIVDPLTEAERTEIRQSLRRTIASLPQPYRQVLALHLEHDLNAKQIGEVLERPAGTVRSQVVRGLELLRRALPVGLATGVACLLTPGHALAGVRAEVVRAAARLADGSAAPRVGDAIVSRVGVAAIATATLTLVAVAALHLTDQDPVEAFSASGTDTTAAAASAAMGSSSMSRGSTTATRVTLQEHGDAGALTTSLTMTVDWGPERRPLGRHSFELIRSDEPTLLAQSRQLLATHRLMTDESGQLRLEGLEPGVYELRPIGALQQLRLEVAPGQHVERSWSLPARHVVSGRVVDDHDAAIAGAEVWTSATGARMDIGHVVTHTTDDGTFEFPCTTKTIVWSAKGDRTPSQTLSVDPAEGGKVVLRTGSEPTAMLSGRALAPDGSPIVDALVCAVFPRSASAPQYAGGYAPRYARSGPDGSYTLDRLPHGRAAVVLRAPTGATRRVAVELDPGGHRHLDLRLDRSAALAGHLAAADGRPLRHHIVFAETTPLSHDIPSENVRVVIVYSDANGAFEFDNLPPEHVRLRVLSADRQSWVARGHFHLHPGERIEWSPRVGAAVTGRVRDDRGTPLSDAVVVATPRHGGDWRIRHHRARLGRSNALGQFAISGLEANEEYRVAAYPQDFVGTFDGFAALASIDGVFTGRTSLDLVVDPQDPATCVTGALATAAGGVVSDGQVLLRRLPDSQPIARPVDPKTGRFAIEALHKGRYGLGYRSDDCADQWLTTVDLTGSDRELDVVRTRPTGRLVVALDRPTDGVVAQLLDPDGRIVVVLDPDDEAFATAGRLPAGGDYVVRLFGAACCPHDTAVTIAPGATTKITTVTEPGVRCALRFPFAVIENTFDGPGVLWVRIATDDDHTVFESFTRAVDGDAFTLDQALPPGRYRIEAMTAWSARGSADYAVPEAGAPVAVTVPLRLD